MDARAATDVCGLSVRRSRVVRAPRCWRYVGGKFPADNGGKRAVLREEHEVSRKAIAQGRPECSQLPCMLVCSFVCANRTRDRGCSKHPVFPAPSDWRGREISGKPRAYHVARMRKLVQPSLRGAKRPRGGGPAYRWRSCGLRLRQTRRANHF